METDLKPIETIHRMPLHTAPKRLQRMLMRVQQYDINIQYKQLRARIQMLLADTLSRAYITDHSTSINQIEKTFEQIDLSQHIPVTTEIISEIKVATERAANSPALSGRLPHLGPFSRLPTFDIKSPAI